MPELPEVEVTRQGLLPHLHQRRIISVAWSLKRLRLPMPRKLLQQSVQDNTITTVDRRAKYILIRMEDGTVLVLHLGMTGKLGLFRKDTPIAVHDHLRLRLDNGMELRFNDARRFGSITVWPAGQASKLEEVFNRSQGIEPFGPQFTAANLARLGAGKSMPIKNFLMDSRIIAGVGNIYANETLFRASVHPQARTSSLTDQQWQEITESCRHILARAIAAGGSTISDFLGSSGQPGYFQLQLAVYGKKGEPCPRCGTTIQKKSLAGRATYYCLGCQPL